MVDNKKTGDQKGKKRSQGPKTVTGGPRLVLRKGDIGIKGLRFFNIPISITVIGKDKKPKPNCEVKLFHDLNQIGPIVTLPDGKKTFKPIVTGTNGKGILYYDSLNTDFLRNNFDGKEIIIRGEATIDDIFVEAEILIKLNLPAGGIIRGLQAAKIRRYHLFGDFTKATALTAFALYFLNYSGNGMVNFILGIGLGAITYWVVNSKRQNWKRSNKILISAALPAISYIVPDSIVGPMQFAVLYSYFIGGFLFFLEELWRRADGNPFQNFYPWWALYFAGTFIAFDLFTCMSKFLPGYISSFASTSSFSKSIPFELVEFASSTTANNGTSSIIGNIKDIYTWALCIIFLTLYGVPRDLWESFTGKGQIKVGEGNVMGVALLAPLWLLLKNLFKRTGGKT